MWTMTVANNAKTRQIYDFRIVLVAVTAVLKRAKRMVFAPAAGHIMAQTVLLSSVQTPPVSGLVQVSSVTDPTQEHVIAPRDSATAKQVPLAKIVTGSYVHIRTTMLRVWRGNAMERAHVIVNGADVNVITSDSTAHPATKCGVLASQEIQMASCLITLRGQTHSMDLKKVSPSGRMSVVVNTVVSANLQQAHVFAIQVGMVRTAPCMGTGRRQPPKKIRVRII